MKNGKTKIIRLFLVIVESHRGIIHYVKIKIILFVISILNCRVVNSEKLGSGKVELTMVGSLRGTDGVSDGSELSPVIGYDIHRVGHL